jgi:hypothetical protein
MLSLIVCCVLTMLFVATEEPGKTHDHLLGMLIAQSINDPEGFTRQEVLDEAVMFYTVRLTATLVDNRHVRGITVSHTGWDGNHSSYFAVCTA